MEYAAQRGIAHAGDLRLTAGVNCEQIRDTELGATRDLLMSFGAAIANLETPLSRRGTSTHKAVVFRSDPVLADQIRDFGFTRSNSGEQSHLWITAKKRCWIP
jgi:hypothetical protein